MIGIYKITSPSNKVYIGQSIDIDKRFNQYRSISQTRKQKRLHHSFRKHGIDNHIFEVLEECSIGSLNQRERYYQDFYNVLEFGLNCLLTDTNECIKVYSKETIEKIRQGNIGKEIPKDVRIRTSETMKLKGIKPKYKLIGFDNPKSIKIRCFNIITNQELVMNLSQSTKYFNVDRELICNRLNKITKSFRKLKDWTFEYV